MTSSSEAVAWVAAISVGLSVAGFMPSLLWARATHRLLAWGSRERERLREELTRLRAPLGADHFLLGQFILALVALAFLAVVPWASLVCVACGGGARVVVRVALHRRREAIEKQIEGWLTLLARSLEAAPSLGEAFEASSKMIDRPLRDELEVLVSELHLGTPFEEALKRLDRRIESRVASLAISTLLVGRQTGGQLPRVLKTAADSLREMARLDGVIRTKTAEGKAQAWVISVLPFPLYLALEHVDPHYFALMETTTWGHVLTAVAALLWIGALLSARKILAVRI